MASLRENKNGCETNQKRFHNQEESSHLIKQDSTLNNGEPRIKKRKTEGDVEFFFKLFRFSEANDQYLLEIHEIQTGCTEQCQVSAYVNKGRWKVKVCNVAPGNHIVVPVLQDPSPHIFHKTFDLSLEERLNGWTVETRKRGTGKEDKFYYHRRRQFRSFVEVITFILYSCKVKDLEIINTQKAAQEVLDKQEAAETMMIIASSFITTDEKTITEETNKRPEEVYSFSTRFVNIQVKITKGKRSKRHKKSFDKMNLQDFCVEPL